jgi:hypothetical protein
VHEKLDSYSLSGERRHIHDLINPSFRIHTLMKDCLQNIAINIGDIGVLPVKIDSVRGAIPVPEA